ncbi:MAG: lysophospholipid acyltransferase family protein [Planctomycetota bacterium]
MSVTVEPPPLPPPKARNVLWWTSQLIMQNVFCFWLGYRARGQERLDEAGGGLVLANHQSFLDPLLVGLPLHRPISFVARDSLFKVPVVGWILRNTYVMPISRESASSASLRETIRRMQHGFLVGVFPEGTRTETGEVGPFKPGFVALIRRAKLPVYPVGIAGAFQAMGKGSWFMKPARVRIVVGEPISVEELAQFGGRDKDDALIELVRSRIVECYVQAEAWRTGAEQRLTDH